MTNGTAIEWHGTEAIDSIEGELERRLDKAAERLRAKVVQNISSPGETDETPRRDGEYPRVASGLLRRRLFTDRAAPLTRRVLTDLSYGLWLETGTSTMSAHPFLTQTLHESAQEIVKMIAEEIVSP